MKIHVGPVAQPELEAAVRAGGAELSSAEEASALVWYGAGPERFHELFHEGMEWVQLPAAGVETWFAGGVLREGVRFTSAAGVYAETVAEHTLAMMLAAFRQLHTMARADRWAPPEGIRSLFGATVGILGAGGIGRALIGLLEPFGVRILAVNRSGRPVNGAARTWPSEDAGGVRELLSASDFVVVAAPATAQTAKLVDAEALALMKSDAWLVNVARGSLVDTDALVAALAEGRIGGAALDVTDPEPLPDGHPLFDEPRALVSPHTANPKSLLVPALARRVEENVRRHLAGEPLLGVVDVAAGY
ncbi:D-3-phosphoglycerate dehydrogenase [Saccharopolyspora erythraea NRRL 2338]|uniref:D-isomer specific 2-hydroxyacid dehydrogenase family protein n=2 Tax=Saccharopolyspora erythraea TaxID=1836 RepID=A4FM79_SACEN|nr:D-isomer specific 2-hydroxyacid dehydrogenase family protein [Saccharopolyspora erythraea]EQD87745.1 2-hydroxyacid dehydrogenase [Saccharopolyspora erythraea D]PFG98791.1 D-3-phosphoglycerate dehydrogenase [Saccharopolyspora erythraea NRRL 2338]QRK88792.1 hydroxyacid dehydrogenase [Saccharopolyspora erythraea]CAM05154.1 D-isomer specific 2-hydroxyacid dehydrogenase family protein [Saccharopolyspora erythraea NRRL 2338]